MLARGILGSGRTRSVSFWPFLNSSGWWWLISSIFLIRISCHKTTHANSYYGAWPGWAVSVSMLPLTMVYVCVCVLVAQSCPTICNFMDCSLPGSCVRGILQKWRTMKWAAISFCRGSSWSKNRVQVSCTAGRVFTIWATRETHW